MRTARLRITIRTKVLGGVLLVLLPLLAVLLFGLEENYRMRQATLLGSMRQTSETAGLLVDSTLESWRALASVVAAHEVVLDASPSAQEFMARVARDRPEVLNIAIFDLQGNQIVALAETRAPISIRDRAYFQEVLATREPAISSVLMGRAVGRPLVAAAAPILDQTERLQGVAVVSFQLDQLSNVVSSIRLRQEQALFLLDGTARLAYHSSLRDPTWEERDFSKVEEVRLARTGELVLSGDFSGLFEDDRRIAALVRSPRFGWVVGVSWNARSAFAEMRRVRRLQVVGFVVVAVMAIAGALQLARYIDGRVRRLARDVERVGQGELPEVAAARGPKPHRDELDDLRGSFHRMAKELRAERSRRETFVSSVAHDLKNLITPVTLSAQMLLRKGAVTPELVGQTASRLVDQIGRIQRLVSDLLDVSRIDAGSFSLIYEPVDLAAVTRGVVDEQRLANPGRSVDFSAPEQLLVEGDGQRLGQVITNLVNNALKYSPEGGDVRVAVQRQGELAHVEVTDSGIGLDSHELSRVFEAYARAPGDAERIRGLGLGLYIARSIIEAHGGTLTAESKGLGRGSTFKFSIPLQRPPPEGPAGGAS